MNKQKKILIPVVIITVIAVAVVLFILLQPEKDPARKFARLLSGHNLEKPNIVFITLDTTRADRLPCYGYDKVKTPYLDELAREGVVFEQCFSPTALTLPSHSSMMTGIYPTYHGVRVNGNTALSQNHATLAELFNRQGYRCGAFIAAFVLDGRWGLKQGFHYYDDNFDLQKYKQLDLGRVQRPGDQVMDEALSWLDNQTDKPFFCWIHLYDPHTPYEPPEPYRSMYGNRGLEGLYDGEIAFTDLQIGRCVSWLRQKGLEKKTILVIMGDHGEGLGEHGELTHGYFIYDYAVHVPFLIITPFDDLKGIRVPTQVRTIDLYPTLLEMVNLPVPAENQGESLIPALFEPQKTVHRKVYGESMTPGIQYGWASLHSLRTGKYKYIEAPRPELYDLANDPEERNNLVRRLPDLAKRFKNELKQIMDTTSEGAPEPETANLDSDTLQRLATLGYVGAPVSKKSRKHGQLADPKDKQEIFEAISLASEYVSREKYAEAAKQLEGVLAKEPGIPQAKLVLATCYEELDRVEDAKKQLDDILKDDPNSLQALIGMASLLSEEGKDEDVITLCKKAISMDERNTLAYTLIGEVYMGKLEHENALEYLEKAVEIQPKLTRNRLNLGACYLGLKRYGEANKILKDIAAKNPKFPSVHFHLGLLYEEQGQFESARDAYREEVKLHDKFVPARFNLGKLLLRFNDFEGYMSHMREVVKLAPKKAEGYLFLARGMLRRSDDPVEIEKLVQKGISLAQKARLKAFGYFLLADIYNRQGKPGKVKQVLEKGNYYKEESQKEK